ncbi:hypothetical protein [Microbacterium sp. GCS4]|uniref:hypothetical protein n=1 Tax=Microbacterium sp. GCS4 TaxID=1692239 RepID=UPI000A983061|nr:hypothetical protein [Microbacterium sp. GCS4]
MWELRSPFGEVPFDLAMLALGAGVFLLESSNLVVRAALDGEHTWRPTDITRVTSGADGPASPEAETAPDSGTAPDPGTAPATAAAADAASFSGAGDPADDPLHLAAGSRAPRDPRAGFKGGRLIGPLERILVLILTLAAAYPILAAMLAAKGIVRFPEISRDGETGARAEYFLVGSLVSWVIALGAAFLVWWAAHS